MQRTCLSPPLRNSKSLLRHASECIECVQACAYACVCVLLRLGARARRYLRPHGTSGTLCLCVFMLVGVGVGVHVRAHVILLSMCGWFVFVSACIDACVSYVYHASKCLPEVTQKNKSKEGGKKSRSNASEWDRFPRAPPQTVQT